MAISVATKKVLYTMNTEVQLFMHALLSVDVLYTYIPVTR